MKFIIAMWIFVILFFGFAVYKVSPHHKTCNHGESSISGHFNKAHTKFIIDRPAHKTGC